MDKKKDRTRILTLALCVALLGLDLWQLRQLSDLRNQLGSVETNLQMESRRLDEQVQAVRRDMKSAEELVRSWDYAPSVNMEKRCLDVEVSAALKEWREDTAAELVWEIENGGSGSVPMAGDGAGTFTATLELPLDGLWTDYGLYTIIRNGETRHRESLGLLGSAGELLPVQCTSQAGRMQAEYMKDVFTVYECGAELYTGSSETEGHMFRLRRGGEIAAEQAAEPGDRSDSYFCGKLSAEVRPGDEMALTFFCRDKNGLGYEFLLRSWTAAAERDLWDNSTAWVDWPRLTWE